MAPDNHYREEHMDIDAINERYGQDAQAMVKWALEQGGTPIVTTNFRPFEAVILHTVADHDLVPIDAGHLFESSITRIGIRRGTFMRAYMYDLLQRFAGHLDRDRVDAALEAGPRNETSLFDEVVLPVR